MVEVCGSGFRSNTGVVWVPESYIYDQDRLQSHLNSIQGSRRASCQLRERRGSDAAAGLKVLGSRFHCLLFWGVGLRAKGFVFRAHLTFWKRVQGAWDYLPADVPGVKHVST